MENKCPSYYCEKLVPTCGEMEIHGTGKYTVILLKVPLLHK